MTYTDDASGTKLRKVNGLIGASVATDYVDGIQYTGGVIDFIQTEEGLARNNQSGGYSYEYNLIDHLGNVRYSFNINPSTNALTRIQADDYYAFGLQKPVNGGTNKYLYNGKELQDGLGHYDFGARFYDPVIGRWNVVDPLAGDRAEITPYHFVSNNPINRIDPDGMWDDYLIKQSGEIQVTKTEDKFDTFAIENKKGNTEFVAKIDKNADGLLQLPSKIAFNSSDASSSFSMTVKGGNESRAFIRGDAAAALFGAASEANVKDLVVNGFSLSDGTSLAPSVSHKFGKNGDLRYLNTDKSGAATLLDDKKFDLSRQSTLTNALYKYGWKDMISERFGGGNLLPNTSSATERKIGTNHRNHLHLQGFKPRIKTVNQP